MPPVDCAAKPPSGTDITSGFFMRVVFLPLYAERIRLDTRTFPFLSSSFASSSTAALKLASSPEQWAVMIFAISSAFIVLSSSFYSLKMLVTYSIHL